MTYKLKPEPAQDPKSDVDSLERRIQPLSWSLLSKLRCRLKKTVQENKHTEKRLENE